jgi:hypothetical protein
MHMATLHRRGTFALLAAPVRWCCLRQRLSLLTSDTLTDAGIATPDGEDPTDDISEKAKAGVDNVIVGLKDAAKKVTGNDN